jgi:lipopolysaccharide transport system ATP-binding protein
VSDVILSIENVSKEYQLGTFSAGTFGGDVQRWLYKLLGKEDPYKKIGANDRSKKTDDEFVLALQDINFEVKRGEVLGIIGKNGAGKSTLLKLLSRVTSPTTGVIRSRGRMASLLEVGTGFHPELTGMENIYLNGAILGMTKAEIKRKLDDIIDFSGVAKYVDTPVKRYSSGMRVRLGFAVAAFLDPEILVVDEVLAVGDAEFQKQAIGKMQDVSKGEGRTVLFVSHNMGSIKSLCTKGLVLNNGVSVFEGNTNEAVDYYLNQDSKKVGSGSVEFEKDNTKELSLLRVEVLDTKQRIRTTFSQTEEIIIRITFYASDNIIGSRFNLRVKTIHEEDVFLTSSHALTKSGIQKGYGNLDIVIPPNLLNRMRYVFSLNAGIPGKRVLIKNTDVLFVDIENENIGGSDFIEKWPGLVSPKIGWSLNYRNG